MGPTVPRTILWDRFVLGAGSVHAANSTGCGLAGGVFGFSEDHRESCSRRAQSHCRRSRALAYAMKV
jgi:hypothetical protein